MTLAPAIHSDLTQAGGDGDRDDLWGQCALFNRNDLGYDPHSGAIALPYADPAAPIGAGRRKPALGGFEVAPDLGSRIGTLTWYRGVATCLALCGVTVLLSPGFENPIYGHVPAPLAGADWDAAHAQAIAPITQGSKTGYRIAATDLVAPLTDTPERPILNLPLNNLSGFNFANLLRRSGVGRDEADRVLALVSDALPLSDIQSGTHGDLTLGRRADKSQPRPLEKLAFRARFDLKLEVARENGALKLTEIPIAIDHTPLRIRGRADGSLYRAARAAGAPAKAVEAFLKAVSTRVPVSKLGVSEFDIIVEQARAETGEVQLGKLLYAGVQQGGTKVQLVRWDNDGRSEWYDSTGRGERTGMMAMPTAGRVTSSYGARRHPVLGFVRMHKGLDIGAPYGAPIYAATDGVVTFAGRNGGYGNFVKVAHAGGLATGYGHMSRIAVRSGTRVRRGQVIGYIGSTGISTGPHLHYELYKNGRAINPSSASFSVVRELKGRDLAEFRGKLSRLMAVPVGAAPKDED